VALPRSLVARGLRDVRVVNLDAYPRQEGTRVDTSPGEEYLPLVSSGRAWPGRNGLSRAVGSPGYGAFGAPVWAQ
jgi:hypothetical protein